MSRVKIESRCKTHGGIMKRFLSLFLVFSLSGCATPAYKEVFRDKKSYNSREFPVAQNILYQATTRALCAKNFIIDKEEPEKGFILSKRSFKRGKRTIVLVVQAKLDPNGADKTMLYLSALETTEISYVADHTRFFLFLIPLPGGGGKEATQIKEGERVVDDKTFYKDFFEAIGEEVERIPKVASQPVQLPPEALKSDTEKPAPKEENVSAPDVGADK